jgi:hypothetical protein
MTNHKWDEITNTCKKCGIKREIRSLYDTNSKKYGRLIQYLFDGKWVTRRPDCNWNDSNGGNKLN